MPTTVPRPQMSRRTSDDILAEHAADVAHTVGINMTKVAPSGVCSDPARMFELRLHGPDPQNRR